MFLQSGCLQGEIDMSGDGEAVFVSEDYEVSNETDLEWPGQVEEFNGTDLEWPDRTAGNLSAKAAGLGSFLFPSVLNFRLFQIGKYILNTFLTTKLLLNINQMKFGCFS